MTRSTCRTRNSPTGYESKDAGQKSGGGESTGHESGRMIVDILDKKKTDYTDDDIDQMRRVTGYIHRHLA